MEAGFADKDSAALPSQLYKYRRPDIGNLLRILIGNELWAAKPASFNDPFDCFPFIDLSGSYEEALAYIDLRNARLAWQISEDDRVALAHQIARRGLGSISNSDDPDLWRQSLAEFGVISFSAECLNVLMWSHYAENHTGVCLEFATDVAPFGVVGKVEYKEDRPIFRILDRDRRGLMERVLLHKADMWGYEKEWRHFRIKEGPGVTPFPASALKSIILGANVQPGFESDLRTLLAVRELQIPIGKAKFDLKAFRLHLE